jgi:hypothetical protein
LLIDQVLDQQNCVLGIIIPFALFAICGVMFITRAILLVVDFNINLHSIAYIAEKEIQNTSQGHLDKLEKIASTRESLSRFDSFKDAFECEQSSINFVLFGKWYIEKREFFKGFIVLKIMLFFFILFMIPVVGLILGYPRTWNIEFGDIDCNSVQIFSTYVELSILLLCSFLAFAIYRRLKRVQERAKMEFNFNLSIDDVYHYHYVFIRSFDGNTQIKFQYVDMENSNNYFASDQYHISIFLQDHLQDTALFSKSK